MSQLLGTVIASQITTGNTVSTFSIGDTNLMQGGHHSVTSLAERDAITTERRRQGMTCWVAGTINTLYRLSTGTNNSDWVQEVAGAGTTGGDQTLAYSALTTAWTGTAGAASAIGLANQALLTAFTGTVIPPLSGLPDVNVPFPTAQQILTFNGTQWVASDPVATVAANAVTFFLDDTASGTAGYSSLLSIPSGTIETLNPVALNNNLVFIEGYISPPLNRTSLSPGVWEFNTYVSVSDETRPANVVVEILTRSNAGAETFLFSGTTPGVSGTTAQLTTIFQTQPPYPVSSTDKLVAKYYGVRTGSPVTLTLYHNGTDHFSHFHTPFGVAHNDLAGLQGGTTAEYYHTTAGQNQALAGSSGVPSASNPFVTQSDPKFSAALNAAWAGTLAATSAYNLSAIGTNVGTNALNEAAAGIALANQALITAWAGTNASGGAAYNLAAIGTNVGTNALNEAAAGITLANQALTTAWLGTNSNGPLAYTALQTAWSGTSGANSALSIAVAGTVAAARAYSLAAIGTNTGTNALNEAAAAITLANQALTTAFAGTLASGAAAYNLAAIGTNVGTNALNEGAGAITIGNKALVNSWTGTDAFTLANLALQTAYTGTSIVNVLAVQVFM